MLEPEIGIDPETRIKERFDKNPSLRVAFALGNDERRNPSVDVFEYYTVGAANREDERIELKDLFFLPKKDGNWIANWVNFSTPEEVENEFAFYLGANYISSEEYLLLLDAMKLTRQIHGSEKRKDGVRRSLNGHILPGMRFIFDNRKEVIDSILEEDNASFFERLFTYLAHDWIEDSKDEFLKQKIGEFPEHLLVRINNLSHIKANGVSDEEYAKKIENAGSVEKFVKMVDRMMNLMDDRGKAPSLEVMKNPGQLSKTEKYLEETKKYYLEMFRGAGLPLFDKFEQVVNHIEEDSKLSKEFLKFVRNEVEDWSKKKGKRDIYSVVDADHEGKVRRERSPAEKLAHIERMIKDLEENSAKYGIFPSTGAVASIYFHDLVKDGRFIGLIRNKLQNLDKAVDSDSAIAVLKELEIAEDVNPASIANLLRYSIAIANGSRSVENKSLIEKGQVGILYGKQTEEVRDLLSDVFSKPPKRSRIGKPNMREQAMSRFEEQKVELYKIIPAPDKIKFNTFRKILEHDVEAVLLRTLEIIDNIKNLPSFDNTYAWRNCQEALYFLLPLLESFGLKGAAKELKDVVGLHTYEVVYGKDVVNAAQEAIDRIKDREEFSVLERTIVRVVGDAAVVEFDSKAIGSTLEKFIQEGRSVSTDLKRCRVVLPPTVEDKDLLTNAIDIIKKVVSQTSDQNVQIYINRPYESVEGKDPKLPLRISLNKEEVDEWAEELIIDLKKDLEIPDIENLHEFPDRPTAYKDVKVVFKINPEDGSDAIYYEMIITDSLRHYNNTFGSAARVFKHIVSKSEVGKREPTPEEREILNRLYQRTLAYSVFSNSGLNLARGSLKWLADRPLGRPDSVVDEEIISTLEGILMHNPEYVLP